MKTASNVINKFYGGIARDDKSRIVGSASNMEELDIFSNENYFQAEQIMSLDSMPASTEVYAYSAGDDDVVYGYGRETAANKVRLVSVASGGADNPGAFSTLATESDATNLYSLVSDLKFFRTVEASNPTSLYWIKGASTSWYIARYNIGATAFQRYTGSAWSASGSWDASSQLTGLNGSYMRPTMKVIFGELYICNGRYIAKIDKDGVFTDKAFTLPQEWEAIDIIGVSDAAIILCRNKNRLVNESKGYWWDLTTTSSFEDSFSIPVGGPCWIQNHKETIKILCAINGKARIFQMSGAFPGAVPIELPGILITNVAAETSTQPISSPKMVSQKDKVLYFGLYKTDKTGIYAVGQLDADKPNALLLSKRFYTSDYSLQAPTGLLIQGPNFYGAFLDDATYRNTRCESNNSPTRSSQAAYESIEIDFNEPFRDKELTGVYVGTKTLSASTSVAVSIATDYAASYTAITKPDATNHTTGVVAKLDSRAFANKKSYRVKLELTSSTTNSPKVQNILAVANVKEVFATA